MVKLDKALVKLGKEMGRHMQDHVNKLPLYSYSILDK